MQINSISLKDFRNVKLQNVSFSPGVNVLCGDNAQGKTNLVEAIYYLACAKSFRGAKDKELLRFDCKQGEILAQITASGRDLTLEVQLSDKPKRIFINRVQISKMREFMGVFRAVLFTPEHLSLIKGSPGERRSFIDSAICQLKPRFVSLLFEYSKVLEQRAALLRSCRLNDAVNDDSFEFWNFKLAQDAAEIILARREYAEALNRYSSEFYGEFCHGREHLNLHYRSVPEDLQTAAEISEHIIKRLEENLASDIKNGSSSVGPHRDDISVEIDTKLSRLYSSQGQQRSAILAMKLAEGEISKLVTGEYPVFLFDDILSELDAERQGYILNKINSKQVFITGCLDAMFAGLRSANLLHVTHGEYWN